jgi:hypothetical protein
MGVANGRCRRRTRGFLLTAVAAATSLAIVAVPTTHAQEPAICGQYEGLPQCLPNDPGDVGDDGDQGGSDDGPAGGPQTSSESGDGSLPGAFPGSGGGPSGSVAAAAGGELPFTGYPLTPLVWLLLLLLTLGLCVRGYLAIRDRLRARADARVG